MKRNLSILFVSCVMLLLLLQLNSCNNPFSTREPDKPGSEGAAIKPPKSPENVLDNLSASFEGLSIQDYLDVFSEDFEFNPDSEDSLEYEEIFVNGWNYERETEFAQNFLQRKNFKQDIESSPIDISPLYEYKPGQDMYEYDYHMFILESDSTVTNYYIKLEIEGRAWLYLREDTEGRWAIYKWVDFRLHPHSKSWGVLRAQNI